MKKEEIKIIEINAKINKMRSKEEIEKEILWCKELIECRTEANGQSLKKLEELNKELESLKLPWRPEIGETFWYINIYLEVRNNYYTHSDDKKFFNTNNCFKTSELAQFEADKRKVLIEMDNYMNELNEYKDPIHPYSAIYIRIDKDLVKNIDVCGYGSTISKYRFKNHTLAEMFINKFKDQMLKYNIDL